MGRRREYEQAEIVRPMGQPLPEVIAQKAQFFYIHRDGVRLRVMLAKTGNDDPRGSILFCPGRTEFIEKYYEVVEDFMNRGFNVLVIDPRGQGLSDRLLEDRLKSYVGNFQDYADDLAFAADSFKEDLPKPHIVMGHSMGGCVALLSVISGALNPAAVVCAAPMLGVFDVETRMTEWFIRIFDVLGFSKKNLPFQKKTGGLPVPFKDNKLMSDRTRYERWAAYFKTTPELRVAGPTFAWVSQALSAMSYVNRNAKQLKIPGLIVAAGADPIVEPASNEDFAKDAGIQFKVIPGALHEIFMERDECRDQFFEAFDGFLKKEGF